MLEVERQRLILRLVERQSVISVARLVETLGASEATVRRDINALAEQGQLRRIRGGAESLTPRHEAHLVGMPFELSRGIGAREKSAIARAAVDLVKEGEGIIINGGTTTYAMVEYLVGRELDILTNSLPIVTTLLASSRNRMTLTGGTIYREQNIVLSPYGSDVIEHFYAQKLFTGCFGINHLGVMEADPLIAQAELKLLDRADEIIVLADSRKLRQRSSMVVIGLERVAMLVTDSGATEEELQPFRSAGLRVITVDVPAEDSNAEITGESA